MAVLDLWTGQMCELPEADTHIETSAALPADLQAPQVTAIQFGVFSDGRNFAHARRLRTDYHFSWPIIATGHVIADQIDYLRRCDFTHAAIKTAHHPQR